MLIINSSNVNDALVKAIDLIKIEGSNTSTRNGNAIEFQTPVTTVYHRPKERVMIYKERDANPFFHLMESMWMFAGRNDVRWLGKYSKMISSYSTDGETFNAAYGNRIRNHFDMDQFKEAIYRLKTYPNDRRTVIQMWDGHIDLSRTNDELDIPCNTAMYLSVQNGKLNMTVTNRSNDMLWGAYGANAVHFSFFQEYIAAAVGVDIGIYYQMSNNLHVYTDFGPWDRVKDLTKVRCPYKTEHVYPKPLVDNAHRFLREVEDFCDGESKGFKNEFLTDVAVPIRDTHRIYKTGDKQSALFHAHENLFAADWKIAIIEWLERRIIQEGKK